MYFSFSNSPSLALKELASFFVDFLFLGVIRISSLV